MLTITFYPESEKSEFLIATNEYQRIWAQEATKILTVITNVSGLSFVETHINALIFEGISFAYPLMLRASYSEEEKRTTLLHELTHRLLVGNGIKVKLIGVDMEIARLQSHKQIDLILFDILSDLYGEAFAQKTVQMESQRKPVYAQAWNWALSLTKNERTQKFSELLKHGSIDGA